MLKNPHIILVCFNLIIISALYGDLLTNSFSIPEEFEQFYESKKTYGRNTTGQSRYELHNYLECKSGNVYEIGIIPEVKIRTGTEIQINETKFLNKVKSFRFRENNSLQEINLSVLLDLYLLIFSILTIIISIVYIFRKHALIEYVLNIFSVALYSLTFVYLYYL